MAKLYDMAQMTVSAGGAGTLTLGVAAVVGGVTYQTFTAAGAVTGDTLSYRISDAGNAWEVGRGAYNSTGPTLGRGLLSSSTGSLLTVTTSALVSIAALAEDFGTDTMPPGGGLTAGSGQGAVVLTAQFSVLATVAAGMAVTLPASVAGLRRIVRNSGANAALVYPPSGGIINTLSANAAMTVQPNLTQYFEADGVQWYSVP
jgi:hypothetical protein